MPVPLVSRDEWKVLQKIYKSEVVKKFRDVDSIVVRRGEINQTTYKKYITDDENQKKLLKGVEIGQYQIRSVISQGDLKWFDEKKFLAENNPKSVVNERRIALQRITGVDEKLRLVGTIVGPGIYFADSTNSIHLKEGKNYLSLNYILGLLNSRLFQWRFKLTSTNNNVGTNELEILPIIVPYDDLPNVLNDIAKQIESKVNLVLEERNQNPEGDTTEVEAEIDRLVYELYGLSEAEIGVVEEEFG